MMQRAVARSVSPFIARTGTRSLTSMGTQGRPLPSAGNGIPRSNVPINAPEEQPQQADMLKNQANTVGACNLECPQAEFEQQQHQDSLKEQSSSMATKFNESSEGVVESARQKMDQAKTKTGEALHNAKEWVKEKTGLGKDHPEAGY